MHVANNRRIASDPATALAESLAPQSGEDKRVGLVAGAPGFGKTSVLAAVASLVARRTQSQIAWVSGGVVGSDGHLAQMLGSGVQLGHHVVSGPAGPQDLALVLDVLAGSTEPIVLAIDDFDSLVFKREVLAERLGIVAARGNALRLVASCHPSARDRLIADHAFARAVSGPIASVTLNPLDDVAAQALIERRVPGLSSAMVVEIVAAAGGHPAALVYLSRLASLRESVSTKVGCTPGQGHHGLLKEFFAQAAEFAGAVYAEAWSGLGPQQRAILWQLGNAGRPVSAGYIARAIRIPASQTSAQLTRLVSDGLVRRGEVRGHFAVAPLLAAWISRRAARSGPEAGGGLSVSTGVGLRRATGRGVSGVRELSRATDASRRSEKQIQTSSHVRHEVRPEER